MKQMTQEEMKLFVKLQEKRKRQDEAFDFSMEGMIRGTEDIYPESAHFVYELLQNADDCCATEASFIISKTNLVFKHNGTEHFTISEDMENVYPYGHINSITAYCSTKTDKDGQIGKFGIGFKSVYQYTEIPEIYDDVFKFLIQNRRIPYIINHDHPLRKEGETLFDLKFKNPKDDYRDILTRLRTLKDPVLFLPHISKITWKLEESNTINCYTREENQIGVWQNTQGRFTVLNNNGSIDKLYVFSRIVQVPKIQKNVEIRVGYYLNDDNSINTQIRPNIYCFFPTEEKYHLCFIPHAPFLLTSNRAGLKKNDVNGTNEFLHNQLSRLASESLIYLKEIGEKNNRLLIDENIFKIISVDDEVPEVVRNNFIDVVRKNNLVLSKGKKYLWTDNVLRGDSEDIETLLSREQLSDLYPELGGVVDFVANKKDRRSDIDNEIVEALGIEILDTESFSKKITVQFLEKQSEGWVDRFYNYIEKHARQLWNKQERKYATISTYPILRLKPIIKTSEGKWVAPYKTLYDDKPEVFLPMEDGTELRGQHYQFVDKDIYNRHKSFFVALGLHQPEIVDFIDRDILPKYREETIEGDDEEIINDFEQLYRIWQTSNDSQKNQIKELLLRDYYLRATDGMYHSINEICDDTDTMRLFYGNDGTYLDYPFYLKNQKGISNAEIRNFVILLGIKYDLTVNKLTGYNYRLVREYDISTRRMPDWWEDYELDGYDPEAITKEISHCIWDYLVRLNKTDLERYLKAKCKGYRNYYQTKEIFETESTLLLCLKEDDWICIDENTFCKPSEITKREFLNLGYDEHLLITGQLEFKKEVVVTGQSLADLGATEEQQQNERKGRIVTDNGLSEEELEEAIRDYKQKRKLNNSHIVGNDEVDIIGHTNSEQAKAKPLDSRYGSGDNPHDGTEKEKELSIPSKTRSKDLNDFIERQQQRIEIEGEKEDIINKMQELPIFTKAWFLNGLRYEYLNSEDTGKDQISRSISISFTKVIPEHSNVYRFSNASKPIPRWLEEIDGDIKVVMKFKSGDELTINFAMACVQDFSLRLRAKGVDEDSLSKIEWNDLTSAILDINNPRGLVKNLYDAFRQLPFGEDYNFQAHLQGNVSFIFGPPGTGKTTYLTREITKLMDGDEKCKVLILAPTNQACDVIVRQLMNQNPDSYFDWLGRFVATNDEIIDQLGVVCDRESTIYTNKKCCLVSTMARLSYDFFENINDGKHFLKDIKWDYVVCDEGSMISLPEIVYTIYKFSFDDQSQYTNTPIIIAGDPKQLQPIDSCNIWGKRSIYDLVELDSFDNPSTTPIQFKITNLETQYRSVPAIGELFSRYSYNGLLKHGRNEKDRLDLNIDGLGLKTITYMPFVVDNYDDIYGAKRMAGSNVHIYSAILTSELCRYISKEYVAGSPQEKLKIGVICPYIAQVQLVEKLLNGYSDIPFSDKLEIVVGTIHSFQGDECNIIFALFNPPKGMASKRQDQFTMLLNDDHLVNVAISRAKDYLCILVPTHDSYGRENLKDINRAADILLSRSYNYKNEVTQIDCSEIEQLLFGKKGYLKSKSYITSHQMANVYTPTGYTYDIRVDENAIDIQIGADEKQSLLIHSQNTNIENKEQITLGEINIDDYSLDEFDILSTIPPKTVEKTNENSKSENGISFGDGVVEVGVTSTTDSSALLADSNLTIRDAIKNHKEEEIKSLLSEPQGVQIPAYRKAIQDLVEQECAGSDFWFLLKMILKYNPTIFRKPVIDALDNINNIDRLVTDTINDNIKEITSFLFKDPEKVAQDIELIYHFKDYFRVELTANIRKQCRNINSPTVFFKLFELFPVLSGEEKIGFLLEIHNPAAIFVVCQLLADQNYREKLKPSDFEVYRYAQYRKKIAEQIGSTTELDRIAMRLIKSSFETIPEKEKEWVESIFSGGYEQFCGLVTKKQSQKNRRILIDEMDDHIGEDCNAKYLAEFPNYYLLMTNGFVGLMPKKMSIGEKPQPDKKIVVSIIGADKKKNLYFLSQNKCSIQELQEVPLANIGDEIEVSFFYEGDVCYVRSGCPKQVEPIVLGQVKNFDYKARYKAKIVGRRSFYKYEIKITEKISSEETPPTTYRINKICKELNIGIQTIVRYLAQHGYRIAANPNTRIGDTEYQLLLNAFGK